MAIKRVPLHSVEFSDSKGDIRGYAKEWYFWVHESFRDALDIRITETIDKAKTAIARDKKSIELFGISHAELKLGIQASSKKLGSSKKHKQVMAVSVTDGGHLTESSQPWYEFRVTDGLESRSGEWYVQVDQTAETDGAPQSVGFKLFSRNHSPNKGDGIWKRVTWISMPQAEFVSLLKTGRCSVIDLENPPEFEDTAASGVGAVQSEALLGPQDDKPRSVAELGMETGA